MILRALLAIILAGLTVSIVTLVIVILLALVLQFISITGGTPYDYFT